MAKKPSGGDGFYANFSFDYCEGLFPTRECYRAGDSLGISCYQEVVRLLETYGDEEPAGIFLDDPYNYGFDVKVYGIQITGLSYEWDTYYMTGYYEDNFNVLIVRISDDGSLVADVPII